MTVPSATVDFSQKSVVKNFLAWSSRLSTVTAVDRWVCPVDFSFLDSVVDRSQHGGRPFPGNPVKLLVLSLAVDRSQHGGRPLPYFSVIFTSTNN